MFSNRLRVLSAVLLTLAACKSTSTPSNGKKSGPQLKKPLTALQIEATAFDGNRDSRTLDPDKLAHVVDSDGMLVLRFDNSELLEALEADLRKGIGLLQKRLDELKSDNPPRSPIDPQALDLVEAPLGEYSILVKGFRTTPKNVRSQIHIPEWTEGVAPEVATRDLPARIDRLVDELKAKAKEVTDAEKPESPAPDDAVPQGLLEGPLKPATETEETKTLKNIRRGLLGVLPQARISLARLGVERGDCLDLFVEFHLEENKKQANPEPKYELVDLAEYHLEVEDLGWEPHIRPQLILYRGTESGQRDWKLNAAGLVEWAYRYRNPSNCFQDFVNGWEPALGVHVASLGQGDDTVEIGLGINASLFRGLLSAGWGRNLSEQGRYYFFGGDLLKLLDAAKELRK